MCVDRVQCTLHTSTASFKTNTHSRSIINGAFNPNCIDRVQSYKNYDESTQKKTYSNTRK